MVLLDKNKFLFLNLSHWGNIIASTNNDLNVVCWWWCDDDDDRCGMMVCVLEGGGEELFSSIAFGFF